MNTPAPAAPTSDTAFGTIAGLIRDHARRHPGSPALVQDDRRVTYAELDALMDRVAGALQRDGVQPQQAIAICAATSIDYAVVFLGALRAGVAVAPLAPSCTAEEIAGMAGDAGARVFFLDAAVAHTLQPVAGRIAGRRIALDDSPAGASLAAWLAPAGSQPAPAEVQPT